MKTVILFLTISVLAAPILSAPTATCASSTGNFIGCASCVDANANSACDKCKPGYRLNTATPKTCSLCPTGGSVNENMLAATEACPVACTGGCQSCTETAGTCTSCKAGYFMSATGVCSFCANGKGKDADPTTAVVANTDQATACTVTCTGAGALSCGAAAVSLSCKAGYWLSAAGTCSWCTGGKGKDADATTGPATVAANEAAACTATCTPASGCGTCSATALGACLACAAGKYVETATGTTKDTCVACTTGCKTCTATGLAACPSCSDNFYYSAANTCKACDSGKTRTAPATVPTAPEADSVCTAGGSSNTGGSTTGTTTKSASLIQALCGAIVAAYALF